ncbi:MAG: hypothetical protein DSY76_02320 [Bacteroidetes bacterium]|nr:MAG: hypothetical protein DSY76_02320 [Bacteroidota bacterium]
MNTNSTLNLSDYMLEIGNQFFHLDENEWNVEQDELSYESTDRDGFNGYVLKIEETADNYSNVIITSLMKYLSMFYSLIVGYLQKKKVAKPIMKPQNKNNRFTNPQTAINTRVRSRLLEVINEDIDKWNGQQKKISQRKGRPIRKNQFKHSMDNPETIDKSLLNQSFFMRYILKKE